MIRKLIAILTGTALIVSTAGMLTAGAFEFDSSKCSDELTVYLNGVNIYEGETEKPRIMNDRTMVPIRPIFERLNYQAEYDAATQTATFKNPGTGSIYSFTNDVCGGTKYTSDTYENPEFYPFDVPATIYNDKFYVPIRAFCEMVNINIEWDNPLRSVFIGSRNGSASVLLTYEQARAIAVNHVNDPDILLDIDENMVTHNGRPAYAFVLHSKSMIENGGSGTMGMTVYVYADNGEVDDVEEVPGGNLPQNNENPENIGDAWKGDFIHEENCCLGRIVNKEISEEFGTGAIGYNRLIEMSEKYIEQLPDYKTSNGLTPQKALDLISAAFDKTPTGSVRVYSNLIEVDENSGNEDECYYRVYYMPNGSGWGDHGRNIPCYEVYSSGVEDFDEYYTTGAVLDMDYNVIDVAN